ncbi:MAG: NAD(P)-dependent alcohol dehydrogenase [Acidimicrobiia bacterium]|nr:NAD(P)-dependent alcohol dehydrogenase [Acidimicrobiia bacterium]
MKAIVQNEYGSAEVLQLQEVDDPIVKDDEVLVRVRTASVHPGDWLLTTGRPLLFRPTFGLNRPRKRIPGFDFAGVVEAVGKNAGEFKKGDEVYGDAAHGSCAEYVSITEEKVALKPHNLTLEQAAVVPVSGVTALLGVRDAGSLKPGQHVLINGASGGVGTFAVQIAKALGAEVTGVCSTSNVDLVRSIGADHVIDYTKEDFTTGGERYDLILDNVANYSLADCRRAVVPGGKYISNNGTSGGPWLGPLGRMGVSVLVSLFISKQGRPYYSPVRKQDLLDLKDLIEDGKVTPVIGRTFSLSEAVEAMAHVGSGHARGKVAITI